MKSFRTILTLVFVLFVFSCEDSDDFDCDLCVADKPAVGDMKIKLTIKNENTEIPLKIYRTVDDFVILEDIVNTENFKVEAALNREYAVEARYIVDDDTIFVIDADFMEPKEATNCDDEDCWIVKGDVFDVRLKYDK